MTKFAEFIGQNKFLFGRGYSYFGSIGIGFLVADKLSFYLSQWSKIEGFGFIGLFSHIYILFPLAIMGVWFIGYLDVKQKLFAGEVGYSWKNNPEFATLKQAIEESIKKAVEEKRNKNVQNTQSKKNR